MYDLVECYSFEHDFVEEESAAELKERATEMLVEEPEISGRGNIVWNAKVVHVSVLPACFKKHVDSLIKEEDKEN